MYLWNKLFYIKLWLCVNEGQNSMAIYMDWNLFLHNAPYSCMSKSYMSDNIFKNYSGPFYIHESHLKMFCDVWLYFNLMISALDAQNKVLDWELIFSGVYQGRSIAALKEAIGLFFAKPLQRWSLSFPILISLLLHKFEH